MSAAVTLIAGGDVVRRVLDATGADLAWDEPGGDDPEAVIASVKRTGVALGGPVGDGLTEELRSGLGLHAEVLPCKALEGARTRFPETDVVVVRELAGGAAGFERADRVVRAAREYARAHDRHAVLVGHPRGGAPEPAAAEDDLEVSYAEVGELCARLVAHPEEHDVLVLPDLLGEIVGHLAVGMAGGLGIAPGLLLGEEVRLFAGVADGGPAENPTGALRSGALLLRHLGDADAADRLDAAVAGVVRRGEEVTSDLKPTPNDPSAVGAEQFADAVLEEMRETR